MSAAPPRFPRRPRGDCRAVSCRCDNVTALHGSEAEEYAREHLHRDEEDVDAFVERLSCPDTGTRWLLDFPERTDREPGPARLQAEPG